MTPRERAIDLRKNLARIGILLDEERAINMIEQAFVIAYTDIHAHESAAIDAALLLTHIDALNSIKHVTACPENANLIDHCDAIVRERDKARAELRDEKQLVERIDELACKAIRERDEARSRSDTFQEECARLMRERDEYRAHADRMSREQGTIIAARAACEQMRRERDEAHVALANVSGALVDSGVIVPEDETRYGEAVRGIARERDEARAALTAETRNLHCEIERGDKAVMELSDANWNLAQRDRMIDAMTNRAQELALEKMAADRRIAELEEFIRRIDYSNRKREDAMNCADNWSRAIREIVCASLSAPAQPALPPPHPTDCATPEMEAEREAVFDAAVKMMKVTAQPATASCTCNVGDAMHMRDCPAAAPPSPAAHWTCSCGYMNAGIVCTKCGKPSPAARKATCSKCGNQTRSLTHCPACKVNYCGRCSDEWQCTKCGACVREGALPVGDVNSSNRDPFDYEQLRRLIHQERWKVPHLDVADIVEVVRKWIDAAREGK